MTSEKRKGFLSEIIENILSPYEASTVYEEDIVGEFENQVELEFFERFVRIVGGDAIILDLACGDGRHTLRLSQGQKHVLAFDMSPNMLKMAKMKCSQVSNVSFIKGSMFCLPFRTNAFDGIWFSQAFEYVPPERREGLLSNLRGLLEEKGIIYMSAETWMLPSLWNSLKELFGDLKLYFHWRFEKGKPLLWGEFLYQLTGEVRDRWKGWHYHVHIDTWTLSRLMRDVGLEKLKEVVDSGYIYILCTRRKLERLIEQIA